MELQNYRAVLRRRWLTVVLTAAAFVVLAGMISASRAPVYETSIDLYVVGRSADGADDYTAGLLAKDRARTYAQLIATRRVAEAIIEDLGLSANPGSVSAQLDGRVSPDSLLVVATVRDLIPETRVLINEGSRREANKLFEVGDTCYHLLETTPPSRCVGKAACSRSSRHETKRSCPTPSLPGNRCGCAPSGARGDQRLAHHI